MENVKIVMRQTNYTEMEALEALKQNSDDVIKTIESYMEIKPPEQEKKTTNQGIYAGIRELLKSQAKSMSGKD